MKTILLSTAFVLLSFCSSGQTTATNFTATDCNGVSHNLFNELDSGNVIILVWVMPCGGCVSAAQTASEIAESYAVSMPGRVRAYIADDYADASCATLNGWLNNNNIDRVTSFSDAAIDMSDYGADGMPKVVVLGGGYSHGVYYNRDNQFANDSIDMHAAVDSALADATVIIGPVVPHMQFVLYPNPATDHAEMYVNSITPEELNIRIVNANGQLVQSFSYTTSTGENLIRINIAEFAAGSYFVKLNPASGEVTLPLTITRRE